MTLLVLVWHVAGRGVGEATVVGGIDVEVGLGSGAVGMKMICPTVRLSGSVKLFTAQNICHADVKLDSQRTEISPSLI